MLRDGTTDLGRTDVAVRDVAEMLADATGAWSREIVASAPAQIERDANAAIGRGTTLTA
jgi:hypothetical protein